MRATIPDYAKLNVEGVVFRTRPKRGWYYKNKFIGYNTHEAIVAVNAIKAGTEEAKSDS